MNNLYIQHACTGQVKGYDDEKTYNWSEKDLEAINSQVGNLMRLKKLKAIRVRDGFTEDGIKIKKEKVKKDNKPVKKTKRNLSGMLVNPFKKKK